jgi:hypothetical protein
MTKTPSLNRFLSEPTRLRYGHDYACPQCPSIILAIKAMQIRRNVAEMPQKCERRHILGVVDEGST